MISTTALLAIALLLSVSHIQASEVTFPVVPSGQRACYGTSGEVIICADRNKNLGGQDAFFTKTGLRYRNNNDGTISDLNTGLMWQQAVGRKMTWGAARSAADTLHLGGHTDWRLPTIKELYSLIDFSGQTPMPGRQGKPFIDGMFDFRYGDTASGERLIDAQFWSANEYVGLTMGRDVTVFGVNFADGRIKGYPKMQPGRGENLMFVRYVRGNPVYGRNEFIDNKDGTVTDKATGLIWLQVDSGILKAGPGGDGRMDWPQALDWAGKLSYAGHTDWCLPNAKELQSIVDYSRSPQVSGEPAINPVFKSSKITDESGKPNFGFYWSSTTHLDGLNPGSAAVYVAFGEAFGFMRLPWSGNRPVLLDVHGAGAQRSDPKQGNPADYPQGMGPQGDVRRIYNLVRLVRTANGSRP